MRNPYRQVIIKLMNISIAYEAISMKCIALAARCMNCINIFWARYRIALARNSSLEVARFNRLRYFAVRWCDIDASTWFCWSRSSDQYNKQAAKQDANCFSFWQSWAKSWRQNEVSTMAYNLQKVSDFLTLLGGITMISTGAGFCPSAATWKTNAKQESVDGFLEHKRQTLLR